MTNVPYSYNKSACIYTLCLAVSELIVGQGSRHNACGIDTSWEELRSNNIEIDRETLSFHINACIRDHEDISVFSLCFLCFLFVPYVISEFSICILLLFSACFLSALCVLSLSPLASLFIPVCVFFMCFLSVFSLFSECSLTVL